MKNDRLDIIADGIAMLSGVICSDEFDKELIQLVIKYRAKQKKPEIEEQMKNANSKEEYVNDQIKILGEEHRELIETAYDNFMNGKNV